MTADDHGIRDELLDLAVPIDDLHPFAKNVRRGDLDALAASLGTHGQYRPVVARQGTGEVLAGNHTLAAARQLGWSHVAATWVDVDDDQAQRIVLVDNRTNDLAGYDRNALADLLQELSVTETGLDGTGFDDDALEELLAGLSAPEDDGPPEGDGASDPTVFGVAVACQSEDQREELISRLREWDYTPQKIDARWGEPKAA